MATRELAGRTAIITGASSGIGRAIAVELAGAGVRLVLVARREGRLRAVAAELDPTGASIEIVAGDVTSPEVRTRAVQTAQSRFGRLDVLVNNAGVGALGQFEHNDEARLRRIMEVNFFAVAELTRAAIPLLKQSDRAIVVNVSSVLGHRGVPQCVEYCASKFALQGLSESLRAQFVRLGIDVLVVSPGPTESEFSQNRLDPEVKAAWASRRSTSADYVARRTVAAIRRGRHEIVPNFGAKLLCWFNRLSPRLADALVARYA